MKKSLVCTVLAGLLLGSVMTVAEAGRTIIIKFDGTLSDSTYNPSGSGSGVSANSVSYTLGDDVKSIETDGDIGYRVNGIYVGENKYVKATSFESIDVRSTVDYGGSMFGIDNSNSGTIEIENLGHIYVKGYQAMGIANFKNLNFVTFSGTGENDRKIEVVSNGSDGLSIAYGLWLQGGTNYIGTKLDNGGNLVVGQEIKSIVATAYSEPTAIKIDGGNNVFLFSGADSRICTTSTHDVTKSVDIQGNGNTRISGIESISANNTGSTGYAYAIYVSNGNNQFDFEGDSFINASTEDVTNLSCGIYVTGGNTTVNGLKNVTVVSPGNSYAIYSTGGTLNISGVDDSDRTNFANDVYAAVGGIINMSHINSTGLIVNNGSLMFDDNNLISDVAGNGTMTVESGLLQYTGTQKIGNIVVIKDGAAFDPKADYLSDDTTVEAGGKLYVSSGTLSTNIKGAGTTYLKASPTSTAQETITVNKANSTVSIAGTLDGSDGTIKFTGGTTSTLSIGKLAGTTNLILDVDLSGTSAKNSKLSIGGAESGAVLNLSNINFASGAGSATSGVITYADGAGVDNVMHKVNDKDTDGKIILNDGTKTYTFTEGLSSGQLNWTLGVEVVTFKQFIEGDNADKIDVFSLSDDMVDGNNNDVADSGLATQTKSNLTVNLNGHTLGTAGNNFTVKVANGKTINVNGGTSASTVYTNWDVADNGVLNISGITNMNGSISGNGQVTNSGTLTISADKLGTGLGNTGIVNLSGGTLANIVDGGQVNIVEDMVATPDYIHGNANTIKSDCHLIILTGGTFHKDLSVEQNAELRINEDIVVDSTAKVSNAGIIDNRAMLTNNGYVEVTSAGSMTQWEALTNNGSMQLDGDIKNFGTLTNNGSMRINGKLSQMGDISNSGDLVINGDLVPGNYNISCDVYHNAGAKTEINLVGERDSEGWTAHSTGRIIGSDDDFKMTLDHARWNINAVAAMDEPQVDDVYNLTLKNSSVVFVSYNNTCGRFNDEGVYELSGRTWKDNYSTVKFRNLNNDGTGSICLAVDLLNDVGDKVVFDGTTPSNIRIDLINKDNNNGEAVSPDAGHKVRYAEARLGDVDLQVNTTLTPMYGKQSMIYTPIVETSESDGLKRWDFVGWDQQVRGESRATAKEEIEIPEIKPELEEKRLEEIHKYAIHKDLSELGAWVRGETGKATSGGVDFDVKVMSGGYDWGNKTSKGNFFMGVGVSHGTSMADKGFVGDSRNTSFSLYGSWYGRKNYDYIDVVAKYGKIKHEYGGANFDGIYCAGEYDKNMYSLFAKYGRRLPLKNGFYVEPFGSFTYGYINSVDFYDKGQQVDMSVDAITSKMFTIGAMVGRSISNTEVYFKFAYSYDFDGKINGRVPSQDYSESTDMGGSSYRMAIGISRLLGKQNSLHFDLEKDFGGKMKRPWNVVLTFKHTW